MSLYNKIMEVCRSFPEKTALEFVSDEAVQTISYLQLAYFINLGKDRLLSMGAKPGSHIGILCENRNEWLMSCFAILGTHSTAVLYDQMQTPESLKEIIELSDLSCLFVSEATWKKFQNIIPTTITFIRIEEFFSPEYSLKEISWETPEDADQNIAFIVFTSGTGGTQNGVMLTHENIMAMIRYGAYLIHPTSEDKILCPLPLNHMYSLSCACLLFMFHGACLVMISRIAGDLIIHTMQSRDITGMFAVPRLYEAIHKSINEKVDQKGKMARVVFNTLLRTSLFFRNAFHINLGKKLFHTIHEKFGTQLRFLGTGGASLPLQISLDFRAMGLPIITGYGMTENSPLISGETPADVRSGSVGKPNTESEVLLMNKNNFGEGEICVRGPCVMQGYYRNPEATKKAIVNGWLHTGDLGKFDKDGYLYITGRIKDQIVTSSGKKISPEYIESMFVKIPEFKESAVVGMRTKNSLNEQIVLSVVPNMDKRQTNESPEEFLARLSQLAIQNSHRLPSYAQINHLYFVDALPKTTTLKIKRNELREILKKLQPYQSNKSSSSLFFEDNDPRYKEFNKQIVDLLKQLKNEEFVKISPRSSLQFDLNIDSLDRMVLKDTLERQFNCSIDENSIFIAERVEDLGHIVSLALNGENQIQVDKPFVYPVNNNIFLNTMSNLWLQLVRVMWKIEVEGLENIPNISPYILAANHTSHLDAYWILSLLDGKQRVNTYTFAKKEHLEHSATRFFASLINSIPIDREGNFTPAMNEGLKKLKEGYNLLIFPEGTRSKNGTLGTLRMGIALLSLRSLAPIIPITLTGGTDILSPDDSFPSLFDYKNWRRRKLTIVIGKPIQPVVKADERKNEKMLIETLQSELLKNYKQ